MSIRYACDNAGCTTWVGAQFLAELGGKSGWVMVGYEMPVQEVAYHFCSVDCLLVGMAAKHEPMEKV